MPWYKLYLFQCNNIVKPEEKEM